MMNSGFELLSSIFFPVFPVASSLLAVLLCAAEQLHGAGTEPAWRIRSDYSTVCVCV